MNKKGIWRVLEAVFAILIVIGGILAFYPRSENAEEFDFVDLINPILEEAARNATVRELVLMDDDINYNAEKEIIDRISKRVKNPRIGYNVTICSFAEQDCELKDVVSEEIYSGERVISANLNTLDPKIIKIYVWKK